MDREAWWATVHGVTKQLDMTEHSTQHCKSLFGDFPKIYQTEEDIFFFFYQNYYMFRGVCVLSEGQCS